FRRAFQSKHPTLRTGASTVCGAPVTPRVRAALGSTPARVQESGGCDHGCAADMQIPCPNALRAEKRRKRLGSKGSSARSEDERTRLGVLLGVPSISDPEGSGCPENGETIGRFGGPGD